MAARHVRMTVICWPNLSVFAPLATVIYCCIFLP